MISNGGRYISASIFDLEDVSDAPPVALDRRSWCVSAESPAHIDGADLWLKMPARPKVSGVSDIRLQPALYSAVLLLTLTTSLTSTQLAENIGVHIILIVEAKIRAHQCLGRTRHRCPDILIISTNAAGTRTTPVHFLL